MTLQRTSLSPLAWLLLYSATITLLLTLQTKLWKSDWSLHHVEQLRAMIATQKKENEALRHRNAAIAADVSDLKQGYESIEERARTELGMVKKDEIFYQLINE